MTLFLDGFPSSEANITSNGVDLLVLGVEREPEILGEISPFETLDENQNQGFWASLSTKKGKELLPHHGSIDDDRRTSEKLTEKIYSG